MRPLVVIEGDASAEVRELNARLLDYDETPDVLSYYLLPISPERRDAEAAAIAERNWPVPTDGELILAVLGDDEAVTAELRLAANDLAAAMAEGKAFLAAHKPPQRDALQLIAAARQEAQSSGRRMWVVSGGPRCGPCFRLARWMDDHHELLDKDYVLVKIMGGLDKRSEAVGVLLPGHESAGIPYHAIVEPAGKVLVTSTSPVGNIGMPASVEEIRHLRAMLEQTAQRLTAEEIAELENSLTAARQ